MTITAIALDDEQILVKDLTRQLNRRTDWVAEPFVVPAEALLRLSMSKVDVCFVDIEMPEQTGLEFAEQLAKVSPATLLIFVTAYSQYATTAFRLRAFDYVVKPVSRALLDEVCANVEAALKENTSGKTMTVGHRIAVKSASKVDFVRVDSIITGQAVGNYVALNCPDKEYVHRTKISDLIEELAPHGFIRTHRSYLVNTSQIKCARRRGEDLIELETFAGHKVPVSASYTDDVTAALKVQQIA